MRYLQYVLSFLIASPLFIGCSNSNPDGNTAIVRLQLNTDKTFAISELDSIVLTANPVDEFSFLVNVDRSEIQYFVNNQFISGTVFYPTERGNFTISAKYRDFESNPVDVEIADLLLDMESLNLTYSGIKKLTNLPWSSSGRFSFASVVRGQSYPLSDQLIPLKLNDT